jgi:hypothetical protein
MLKFLLSFQRGSNEINEALTTGVKGQMKIKNIDKGLG